MSTSQIKPSHDDFTECKTMASLPSETTKKRRHRNNWIAFIIIIVFSLIAILIALLLIFINQKESAITYIEATISNVRFHRSMINRKSKEFRNISRTFCNQIDHFFRSSHLTEIYKNCVVDNLRLSEKSNTIIDFWILFTKSEAFIHSDQVRDIILSKSGRYRRKNNLYLRIGRFLILFKSLRMFLVRTTSTVPDILTSFKENALQPELDAIDYTEDDIAIPASSNETRLSLYEKYPTSQIAITDRLTSQKPSSSSHPLDTNISTFKPSTTSNSFNDNSTDQSPKYSNNFPSNDTKTTGGRSRLRNKTISSKPNSLGRGNNFRMPKRNASNYEYIRSPSPFDRESTTGSELEIPLVKQTEISRSTDPTFLVTGPTVTDHTNLLKNIFIIKLTRTRNYDKERSTISEISRSTDPKFPVTGPTVTDHTNLLKNISIIKLTRTRNYDKESSTIYGMESDKDATTVRVNRFFRKSHELILDSDFKSSGNGPALILRNTRPHKTVGIVGNNNSESLSGLSFDNDNMKEVDDNNNKNIIYNDDSYNYDGYNNNNNNNNNNIPNNNDSYNNDGNESYDNNIYNSNDSNNNYNKYNIYNSNDSNNNDNKYNINNSSDSYNNDNESYNNDGNKSYNIIVNNDSYNNDSYNNDSYNNDSDNNDSNNNNNNNDYDNNEDSNNNNIDRDNINGNNNDYNDNNGDDDSNKMDPDNFKQRSVDHSGDYIEKSTGRLQWGPMESEREFLILSNDSWFGFPVEDDRERFLPDRPNTAGNPQISVPLSVFDIASYLETGDEYSGQGGGDAGESYDYVTEESEGERNSNVVQDGRTVPLNYGIGTIAHLDGRDQLPSVNNSGAPLTTEPSFPLLMNNNRSKNNHNEFKASSNYSIDKEIVQPSIHTNIEGTTKALNTSTDFYHYESYSLNPIDVNNKTKKQYNRSQIVGNSSTVETLADYNELMNLNYGSNKSFLFIYKHLKLNKTVRAGNVSKDRESDILGSGFKEENTSTDFAVIKESSRGLNDSWYAEENLHRTGKRFAGLESNISDISFTFESPNSNKTIDNLRDEEDTTEGLNETDSVNTTVSEDQNIYEELTFHGDKELDSESIGSFDIDDAITTLDNNKTTVYDNNAKNGNERISLTKTDDENGLGKRLRLTDETLAGIRQFPDVNDSHNESTVLKSKSGNVSTNLKDGNPLSLTWVLYSKKLLNNSEPEVYDSSLFQSKILKNNDTLLSNKTEPLLYDRSLFQSKILKNNDTLLSNNTEPLLYDSSLFQSKSLKNNDTAQPNKTEPLLYDRSLFQSKSLKNNDTAQPNKTKPLLYDSSLFQSKSLKNNDTAQPNKTEPLLYDRSLFQITSLNNSGDKNPNNSNNNNKHNTTSSNKVKPRVYNTSLIWGNILLNNNNDTILNNNTNRLYNNYIKKDNSREYFQGTISQLTDFSISLLRDHGQSYSRTSFLSAPQTRINSEIAKPTETSLILTTLSAHTKTRVKANKSLKQSSNSTVPQTDINPAKFHTYDVLFLANGSSFGGSLLGVNGHIETGSKNVSQEGSQTLLSSSITTIIKPTTNNTLTSKPDQTTPKRTVSNRTLLPKRGGSLVALTKHKSRVNIKPSRSGWLAIRVDHALRYFGRENKNESRRVGTATALPRTTTNKDSSLLKHNHQELLLNRNPNPESQLVISTMQLLKGTFHNENLSQPMKIDPSEKNDVNTRTSDVPLFDRIVRNLLTTEPIKSQEGTSLDQYLFLPKSWALNHNQSKSKQDLKEHDTKTSVTDFLYENALINQQFHGGGTEEDGKYFKAYPTKTTLFYETDTSPTDNDKIVHISNLSQSFKTASLPSVYLVDNDVTTPTLFKITDILRNKRFDTSDFKTEGSPDLIADDTLNTFGNNHQRYDKINSTEYNYETTGFLKSYIMPASSIALPSLASVDTKIATEFGTKSREYPLEVTEKIPALPDLPSIFSVERLQTKFGSRYISNHSDFLSRTLEFYNYSSPATTLNDPNARTTSINTINNSSNKTVSVMASEVDRNILITSGTAYDAKNINEKNRIISNITPKGILFSIIEPLIKSFDRTFINTDSRSSQQVRSGLTTTDYVNNQQSFDLEEGLQNSLIITTDTSQQLRSGLKPTDHVNNEQSFNLKEELQNSMIITTYSSNGDNFSNSKPIFDIEELNIDDDIYKNHSQSRDYTNSSGVSNSSDVSRVPVIPKMAVKGTTEARVPFLTFISQGKKPFHNRSSITQTPTDIMSNRSSTVSSKMAAMAKPKKLLGNATKDTISVTVINIKSAGSGWVKVPINKTLVKEEEVGVPRTTTESIGLKVFINTTVDNTSIVTLQKSDNLVVSTNKTSNDPITSLRNKLISTNKTSKNPVTSLLNNKQISTKKTSNDSVTFLLNNKQISTKKTSNDSVTFLLNNKQISTNKTRSDPVNSVIINKQISTNITRSNPLNPVVNNEQISTNKSRNDPVNSVFNKKKISTNITSNDSVTSLLNNKQISTNITNHSVPFLLKNKNISTNITRNDSVTSALNDKPIPFAIADLTQPTFKPNPASFKAFTNTTFPVTTGLTFTDSYLQEDSFSALNTPTSISEIGTSTDEENSTLKNEFITVFGVRQSTRTETNQSENKSTKTKILQLKPGLEGSFRVSKQTMITPRGEVSTSFQYQASESITNQASESITHQASESITHQASESITHQASESVTHQASESITHQASKSITDKASESITNRASESITNQASESITHQVSESVTDKASKSVTNQASKSITDKASESITNRASESITNRASESITNRASKSITNQASEPTAIRANKTTAILLLNTEKNVNGVKKKIQPTTVLSVLPSLTTSQESTEFELTTKHLFSFISNSTVNTTKSRQSTTMNTSDLPPTISTTPTLNTMSLSTLHFKIYPQLGTKIPSSSKLQPAVETTSAVPLTTQFSSKTSKTISKNRNSDIATPTALNTTATMSLSTKQQFSLYHKTVRATNIP